VNIYNAKGRSRSRRMGPKDDGGALMDAGYWKRSESETQTDSE